MVESVPNSVVFPVVEIVTKLISSRPSAVLGV